MSYKFISIFIDLWHKTCNDKGMIGNKSKQKGGDALNDSKPVTNNLLTKHKPKY